MIAIRHIDHLNDGIEIKKIELKDNSAKLKLLNSKYDQLNVELNKKDADKAKLEKQLQDLQKEREKLQADLQAKLQKKEADRLAQAQSAVKTAVVGQTAYAAGGGYMTGCGDNADAAFIYGMESGGRVPGRCNPGAVNEIGCRGIGQACPGGKLPCGADYACQNAFFTKYAMDRYGSWANAKAFWLANNWW